MARKTDAPIEFALGKRRNVYTTVSTRTGEKYSLHLQDDGFASCTCEGFRRYQRCKHATALAATHTYQPRPADGTYEARVEEARLMRILLSGADWRARYGDIPQEDL